MKMNIARALPILTSQHTPLFQGQEQDRSEKKEKAENTFLVKYNILIQRAGKKIFSVKYMH
jgi:hypothetical protein